MLPSPRARVLAKLRISAALVGSSCLRHHTPTTPVIGPITSPESSADPIVDGSDSSRRSLGAWSKAQMSSGQGHLSRHFAKHRDRPLVDFGLRIYQRDPRVGGRGRRQRHRLPAVSVLRAASALRRGPGRIRRDVGRRRHGQRQRRPHRKPGGADQLRPVAIQQHALGSRRCSGCSVWRALGAR